MSTIALPIENKVRELDGKLWLGSNFLSRGHEIAIGPSWEIKQVLDIIDPDIYFTKDPGDGNTELFENLHNAGISVCGLAPEVGINASGFDFAENRKNILEHIDLYFAWGETTAADLRLHYEDDENRNKIRVTGNPRFDLLAEHRNSVYGTESKNLKEKYGEYILVNTNFTLGNPVDNKEKYDKMEQMFPERDLQKERLVESGVYHSFISLIFHLVSKNIADSIVIRPHPGENHSSYQNIFETYDNVCVEHYGDVRPWIQGSIGVIHHDCTTGIEAAMMETPVVSYQAVTEKSESRPLSQIVSYETATVTEVIDWAKECKIGDKTYTMNEEQRKHLEGYFPNIDELAAPKICDHIDSLKPFSGKSEGYKYTTRDKMERSIKSSLIGSNVIYVYDAVRDIMGKNNYRERRKHSKQKFPGLDSNELHSNFESFSELVELNPLSINKVPKAKHTFLVSADS